MTFEEPGGAFFDQEPTVVGDELWLSAARYNSAFVARSTDSGQTWNEVTLPAPPTSGGVRAQLDRESVGLSLADVWDSSLCPDGLPPDDPPIGTYVRGLDPC